jgi:hypothetical protein
MVSTGKGAMQKITYAMLKSVDGLSSRDAGIKLGVGKSSINNAREKVRKGKFFEYDTPATRSVEGARILTIDIESKPITAWVWGLWDQNVGITQIKENGGMICFAAKWLDSEEILFYSTYKDGYHAMVRAAHDLLSEADFVVGYNSVRYDMRRINNEFLAEDLGPAKPYKNIDIMKINKVQFDLPSRKLDYLAQFTGEGAKLEHTGFQLWVDCMNDDPDAWALMEEYNKQDVIITEKTYLHLLPWLTNAPHLGLYGMIDDCCPYCGGTELVESGLTHTNVQSYDLFKCLGCKAWVRGTKTRGQTLTTRAVR